MADKNQWMAFEKTGNVMDYLRYKGVHIQLENEEMGENAVESVNYSDRDDTVRNTYR